MDTAPKAKPLSAALASAILANEAAEAAYGACECETSEDERCNHYTAMVAAGKAVDSARDALRDSDEIRTWVLRECGYEYDTVKASSVESALKKARSNVSRANYSEADGTLWITVSAHCTETGENDSDTVTCDPCEPKCESTDHDWQSPHEIVGGLKENPGIVGHGGGVLITEVCMHCGCARVTDTWAQNPETGEQGLQSVTYETGKYADEIRDTSER